MLAYADDSILQKYCLRNNTEPIAVQNYLSNVYLDDYLHTLLFKLIFRLYKV